MEKKKRFNLLPIHIKMRHRFARNFMGEFLKASRVEQIVLIIPFIVLIIDLEIFLYAWHKKEFIIFTSASFVLFLSVLEIFAVIKEVHEHISGIRNREYIMERLRKIAKKMEKPTVRRLMDEFMKKYGGEYGVDEVYAAACEVMVELRNK